jgi:hypothetical protein
MPKTNNYFPKTSGIYKLSPLYGMLHWTDVALKQGTVNTMLSLIIIKKIGYSQHIWNTQHPCGALENTFDIPHTLHQAPFLWCNISGCYRFISFVFDVPPLIYRHVYNTVFTYVEFLSCCLDCIFRLIYRHNQFSAALKECFLTSMRRKYTHARTHLPTST